jgi:hypothetical protein
MVSSRVQAYDEATQDKFWGDDVDLLDKRRWKAALQNARYHQVLRRYHQRFVHSRQLQLHNLVLQRILAQALPPLGGRFLSDTSL